jgi:hypothetical protein
MEDVSIFYGHLFGLFYVHLIYFVVIWYIFPMLVNCTKKNLATLVLQDGYSLNCFVCGWYKSGAPHLVHIQLERFVQRCIL